ncbi:hypothetical protein A3D84_05575 [Candidatus Woesebacteria bacterium RIFCSPHIGHO2_02_FULL_42_20]|uniref:Glycosyltransferase RgtA/B/C/D-like domain-containing protein n=1 Tax=Candidatus Woesebacteria bacterium RIFCSPHIGHO2_12_FULL_41_24 TaxID=1802510 RepID=A0A1F8AR81_9BACT|nr:MAG: hypothetical protein A2873_00240 [Candidatus Woesebacteria bacterium RIFCSPHIGHO2_01_FULL_42_80]OGM35513.1 MAG: hypothetical protein A3D84_05575 [Candidatus Woesebacteria bacterium RIFCSPHIGHO2_02_FULL_42_20]OGM54276.1 MAG: hypothetical protein A3E44_01965 [Candidatus Woesebacteria bacterium RIFCSPHIGHO2_12_FULL_41_24]OGM66293.1 MAG: hypothetical protein A2969_01725 [Candidatus Woesebacteria bacterium RIFCSPLOWO2_01_FULL_42_67]
MKHKTVFLLVVLLASILRLYKLDRVPVSMFGDELDVGYHAYSILKTGRDYQGNFMPLHFHSLAEWRTPLYLYSTVPTVAIFGISPYGVRLPAAFFGIAGVIAVYLLVKKVTKTKRLAMFAAFLLTVSPWHIQYSRAAFEVTEMLFFLLMALLFYFKAREKSKYLWVAVFFAMLMPWVYSTSKLYVPLVLLTAIFIWRKWLALIPLKHKILAVGTGLVLGLPLIVVTLTGEGSQRFGYVSVFSDPTVVPEVGVDRWEDAKSRGETGEGLSPAIADRLIHNKYTVWLKVITNNYLQSFSTDFLFMNGDPNPRHSIDGIGEFYRIDSIMLLVGIIVFLKSKLEIKVKTFLVILLLLSPISAAITRDGGNHATRLILMLPFIVLLVSYGLNWLRKHKTAFVMCCLLYVVNFIFYQHNYWVHNPYQSERWWHAGWGEAIQLIKQDEKNYDKVIISMAGEPAWIFFAAYMEYPPEAWQENFPIDNKTSLRGFGDVSHIAKYYFGTANVEGGIYSLPSLIDGKTLYLANAKEVGGNLIREPDKTPIGLKLIDSVAFPSGEPAFYLFTKS